MSRPRTGSLLMVTYYMTSPHQPRDTSVIHQRVHIRDHRNDFGAVSFDQRGVKEVSGTVRSATEFKHGYTDRWLALDIRGKVVEWRIWILDHLSVQQLDQSIEALVRGKYIDGTHRFELLERRSRMPPVKTSRPRAAADTAVL